MLVLEQAWLAPSSVTNPFAQSYKMDWGAEPQPTMFAEASLTTMVVEAWSPPQVS
jgi:hypothetical protein